MDNSTHISAIDMVVDASSVAALKLKFDLKQTYSYGPNYSWARVTVNGVQVGASVNPVGNNTDPFTTMTFDLSAYVGTVFNLSIEHSGKYNMAQGSGGRGDDAYVDNVRLYEPVIASTIVDSNATCFGSLDGGATASATSGSAPYSYLWSNTDTTSSITGLAAGMYTVSVVDAEGDTATSLVTITEPAALVISLGNDTTVCINAALTLDAGVFTSYLWDDASTMQTRVAVTATSGSTDYSVMVTDASGCTATDTINVTVSAPVVVNFGNDTSICMNSPLTLDAGVFTSYLWDDATTMQTRLVDSVTIGAADYAVVVTDAMGCTGTDTINVMVNAPIMPNLGNDTSICFGGSITLDAGVFTSYLWDDASTMQTRLVGATVVGSNNYYVSTSDMNGCMSSDTVEITVNAPFNVNLGNDTTLCFGSSLTLNAGVFTSYLWNDGTTMQTMDVNITASGVTTYAVAVMDAFGCVGGDSIVVTGLAPVVVDLGSDTSIIWFGSDTSYTLDAGAGFTSYLWSDGTSDQTNDINLSNQGEVVVIVTDNNGCTGSDTVMVDFILSISSFEVSSLKMYPNPADERINIELTNFKNVREVGITFLSVTGEVVLTQNVQVNGTEFKGSFDVSHLATGTYFVQLEANGEVIVRQFVIK